MNVEWSYDRRRGEFGIFGGRYVPEVLWSPLEEVARALDEAIADQDFCRRERNWWASRAGRPTALTHLETLSTKIGGAQIWAKREDLCLGGAFCVTSVISQALLAKRMGKTRLIGESATGDFGVALGSVGRALDLEVTVFMGRGAAEEESLPMERMAALGVKVVTVDGAVRGRSRAMAEALRTLSVSAESNFYVTSSLASPQPYPRLVGRALSIIGQECKDQLAAQAVHPEYVIAPVGSGSFAAGFFEAFIDERGPQLVGVQAGGEEGSARDAASLVRGRPGVCLGTRSLVLQDEQGQIEAAHAGAPGLAMPVAGPQHARWLQEGKVHYVTVTDEEAVQACRDMTDMEGIFASLESAYGLAYAQKLAPTLNSSDHIVVGITGTRLLDGALVNGNGEERP